MGRMGWKECISHLIDLKTFPKYGLRIASILFVPSLILFDHEVVEFSTLKHLDVILFWGPWVPFSS